MLDKAYDCGESNGAGSVVGKADVRRGRHGSSANESKLGVGVG